jgi:hypothetical protein
LNYALVFTVFVVFAFATSYYYNNREKVASNKACDDINCKCAVKYDELEQRIYNKERREGTD